VIDVKVDPAIDRRRPDRGLSCPCSFASPRGTDGQEAGVTHATAKHIMAWSLIERDSAATLYALTEQEECCASGVACRVHTAAMIRPQILEVAA
jgi:hypothetical protein